MRDKIAGEQSLPSSENAFAIAEPGTRRTKASPKTWYKSVFMHGYQLVSPLAGTLLTNPTASGTYELSNLELHRHIGAPVAPRSNQTLAPIGSEACPQQTAAAKRQQTHPHQPRGGWGATVGSRTKWSRTLPLQHTAGSSTTRQPAKRIWARGREGDSPALTLGPPPPPPPPPWLGSLIRR